jgi:hypothetical protein
LDGVMGVTAAALGPTGYGAPTGYAGALLLLLQHHPSKHPARPIEGVDSDTALVTPESKAKRTDRFMGRGISSN